MTLPVIEYCTQECRLRYFSKHKHEVKCGCGQPHKMEPYGFQIVHWQNGHWQIDCFISKLLADRSTDRSVIEIMRRRMKVHQGNIAKLPCAYPGCNNRVGKNYHIHGDAVYCSHCSHEIGGEG